MNPELVNLRTISKDFPLNRLKIKSSYEEIIMSTIAHYSQLVMPDHLNNVGTLFGGQMISWMDIAAAKTAYRFLRGTGAWGAVTRAIDEVEFTEPVSGGEWVTFTGTVVCAGKSSIQIKVTADVESSDKDRRLACAAIITMVAVKKNNQGDFVKFQHNKLISE